MGQVQQVGRVVRPFRVRALVHRGRVRGLRAAALQGLQSDALPRQAIGSGIPRIGFPADYHTNDVGLF